MPPQKHSSRPRWLKDRLYKSRGYDVILLVEKLEDLKVGLDNDMYIDVIL